MLGVLIGFAFVLSLVILWLLMLLDENKSKIGNLKSLLRTKDIEINRLSLMNSTMSDIEYSRLQDLLKSKDNKIKTLQFKIDWLEKLNSNNNSLENLTPKDIKLIKQYLHPDKHNGKSSEIYTKVVGLLSKES